MKKVLSLFLALTLMLALAAPALAYDMAKAGESTILDTGRHYCAAAIQPDGSLWTWGFNQNGQLGFEGGNENFRYYDLYDRFYQTVPAKVMDDVAAISCGDYYMAAIKTDGSLWTWGVNNYGQLGFAGGNAKAVDFYDYDIQTVPVKVLDDVAAVSCGEEHTAAIKTDGSLWMWGYNYYGQLGFEGGNAKDDRFGRDIQTIPVKVMDDVAAVSCGSLFTAAIKTDGSLWRWGYNEFGQLGFAGGNQPGVIKYQTVPVKVLDDVAAVSCGYGYCTAAIKTDGSLWTWGLGIELGDGSTSRTYRTYPAKILDDVAAVSCDTHVAAIKTDGSLWTWGHNSGGALGNGEEIEGPLVPEKVLDGGAAAVSCGGSLTVLAKTDGSLWVCGASSWGQLGIGSTENSAVFVQVPGFTVAVPGAVQQPTTPAPVETPAPAPTETPAPAPTERPAPAETESSDTLTINGYEINASDWALKDIASAVEVGIGVFDQYAVRTNVGSNMTGNAARGIFFSYISNLFYVLGKGDMLTNAVNWDDNPFSDLYNYPPAYGYGDEVTALYHLGIVNGTSDTTVGYFDHLTREQAATIIQRTATVLGINLPDGDIPFTDGISDWALDGVRHCYAAGLMNGYDDTTFGAKDNYTGEQAIITVYRLYQYAVANGYN